MEEKQGKKQVFGNKLSDETFITLCMIGVLLLVFAIASVCCSEFLQTPEHPQSDHQ